MRLAFQLAWRRHVPAKPRGHAALEPASQFGRAQRYHVSRWNGHFRPRPDGRPQRDRAVAATVGVPRPCRGVSGAQATPSVRQVLADCSACVFDLLPHVHLCHYLPAAEGAPREAGEAGDVPRFGDPFGESGGRRSLCALDPNARGSNPARNLFRSRRRQWQALPRPGRCSLTRRHE